jgi:pimeloyl-ACP methyl ester carboxylesterase
MADLVPDASLVEVPGAGHMVILERKDRVDAALDDLLAAAERRLKRATRAAAVRTS